MLKFYNWDPLCGGSYLFSSFFFFFKLLPFFLVASVLWNWNCSLMLVLLVSSTNHLYTGILSTNTVLYCHHPLIHTLFWTSDNFLRHCLNTNKASTFFCLRISKASTFFCLCNSPKQQHSGGFFYGFSCFFMVTDFAPYFLTILFDVTYNVNSILSILLFCYSS